MLYKFKSDASGDVIMLEATGREVLQIMGKGHDAKGILLPEQMAAAMGALKAAVEREESAGATADAASGDEHGDAKAAARVSLRTRVWPLITLIERSLKADVPVTWGV